MNVTVNSQLLAAELRLLNRVVPTKPAIAILSHALLTADEGGIVLHATDVEVALTSPVEGHVDEQGRAAFPVAKLLQVVEQFADGDVLLTSDGKQVGVACGAFRGRLQAMPADDFPIQPPVDGNSATIDASALRSLIAKTRHAINASGTKHTLKGALLTFAGDAVAMVATDGQRLALSTASRAGADLDVVVPVKALDVLSGGADEGELMLTVGPRHIFFALGDRLLTSRRLEGKFPAYNRIVPTDNALIVNVDRASLTSAMRRVVLTAEENQAVYAFVSEGQMSLSSASVGIGSASESVAVDYAGPPIKACVNGTYLLDFLNAATGQTVTMALKEGGGSLLLTDGDHLGVVALMKQR